MPSPLEPAASRTLLVFTGGQATRLGGVNKALLEVGGKPIIERILDAVGPLAVERIALARVGAEPLGYGLRPVPDVEPHAGVLRALANGLSVASGDVCLLVACDMPFVSRPLFEHALDVLHRETADVVIPRDDYGLQPMHSVYRREPVLEAVQQAIARGDKRMNSYFPSVRVREIRDDELRSLDPEGRAFSNVNTPEELAAARHTASPD
jgi:molybdopterin-guanine dinucleotide biosynthesis protein A